MKKLSLVVLAIISIAAMAVAGNVSAYNATYTHIDYSSSATPTIDGTYGTPASGAGAEWAISQKENFGTNGFWRDEWASTGSGANEYMLIETADATNDAGDYWEICFDGSADSTTGPQAADDLRVVITGHGGSATTQWYKGDGTNWVTTTAVAGTVFAKAEALTTTPKISAAHYVLEIGITAKGDMALGIQWAVRIAYNDAHSGGNGLQMWPPASTNTNPATWGYVDYSMSDNPTADVPEGFGFIAIAALTTVAVVAGAFFLRKRQVTRIVPTKTIV